MDYKLKLDEWLNKNETARIEYLKRAKELRNIWQTASTEARNNKSYVSKTIDDYSIVRGAYKKEIRAALICINGIEYLSSIHQQANDYNKFFRDSSCQVLNKGDSHLIQHYKIEEIIERVKKETQAQRADIIARTFKILCGEPTGVEDCGWTLYLTADSGKKVKMWAIEAGGYNIQCCHIRVLVKECK